MKFPKLRVPSVSRQMIDVFGGYNHNLRIGDGEFYDMQNMTSDYYPVLASRNHRNAKDFKCKNVKGMIAKEHICIISESSLLIIDEITKDKLATIEIEGDLEDGNKQLISMGAYVIIMPDKKWVNTIPKVGEEAVYEQGSIDAEHTTTETVAFEMCKLTGDSLYEKGKEPAKSDTAPENPEDGQLWIDTSSSPHSLKQFSEYHKTWVSIATTYVKIKATGIGKSFNQYDGVTISGIAAEGAENINGSNVLWGCSDDEVIVAGILDEAITQDAPITLSRKAPEMDFVIESGNRLWGCRYGSDANGNFVNEIYASKLGDFKNWNCFMQISTDSWVATCGTDGPFTGAIAHRGFPLFFKENCVHKVYGNFPSNFQVQVTECRGVQRGSYKSLAVVNETLFYKSATGVCAYDGSLTVDVSQAFGNIHYTDAIACAAGNKYYISMKDSSGTYTLFVYDSSKCLWHKEDHIQWASMCAVKNDVYAIHASAEQILTLTHESEIKMYNDTFEWFVESGIIGMNLPDMKYISRLLIRMSLENPNRNKFNTGYATVSVKYDSGEWEDITTVRKTSLRTFAIPVRLKRCDHFQIKIRGMGKCRIYSITKNIEMGSDVP